LAHMHRSELQWAKPVTRLMPPLAFALALPWPLIGFGAWLGYQLVRQHGRLLLRLEALEQGLKALQAQPARPTPAPTASATPSGLPLGSRRILSSRVQERANAPFDELARHLRRPGAGPTRAQIIRQGSCNGKAPLFYLRADLKGTNQ
jgi:hypothetical protein